MTEFRNAVAAAPGPVSSACKAGLEALGRYRSRISCSDGRRLTGSLDLDGALARHPGHARSPRWDYGLGYKPPKGGERAIWIEVHKAETGEVSVVLNKLQWLRDWLAGEAPGLRRLTDRGPPADRYVWIATGKIRIPSNARQRRRLNQAGLKLRQRLDLD